MNKLVNGNTNKRLTKHDKKKNRKTGTKEQQGEREKEKRIPGRESQKQDK